VHRNCEIIGVASGWGAELKGCEDAPEALYKKIALKSCKVEQKYLFDILFPLFQEKHQNIDLHQILPLITDLNEHLGRAVFDAINRGYFPVVIGGDHSIALGTWSGVKASLGKDKKLGLIWMDAYMNARIPGTQSNEFWDQMPLAALLGCGDPSFFVDHIQFPILKPDHVCLVGTRSFESHEKELLDRMKVKVFTMQDIKERGYSEIMQEAISIVSKETDGFGVSLDMSVVDPKEAPGVGSPAGGGIFCNDLFKMLAMVTDHSHLKAFEIVELNPYRDRDERTACICLEILGRIMGHGKPK